MDVAGVGAHLFFQRGKEGDDVVTGGLLDLEDAVHVDVGLFPDGLHGLGGHAAQFGPGFAHGHFHSQPGAVTVLQGPDAAHGGPGVALNHRLPHAEGVDEEEAEEPEPPEVLLAVLPEEVELVDEEAEEEGVDVLFSSLMPLR